MELSLYISAAAEMDAECELIGQLLAGLPRSARWTIKRTPMAGTNELLDLAALINSSIYVILLGADLKAPMGVEWEAAGAAGIRRLAYRCTTRVASPAAGSFAREAGAVWQRYDEPHALLRQFERGLIQTLINGTPGYGLDLQAISELAARLQELDDQPDEPQTEDRRGAGHGGVILASR